ncbi:MAG: hypothetical protein M3R17_14660, partial [Bacteroidota bacterium]|nr:hypothetical protein [Bacteroidota bacterium]
MRKVQLAFLLCFISGYSFSQFGPGYAGYHATTYYLEDRYDSASACFNESHKIKSISVYAYPDDSLNETRDSAFFVKYFYCRNGMERSDSSSTRMHDFAAYKKFDTVTSACPSQAPVYFDTTISFIHPIWNTTKVTETYNKAGNLIYREEYFEGKKFGLLKWWLYHYESSLNETHYTRYEYKYDA